MPVGSVGADPNNWYIDKKGLGTNSIIQGKSAEEMGMDDFFSLLTAQMTNQDMMNPESDTDYIAQMAQFTTLRGIQTIQEYQLSSYATSYVGKNVAIAHQGETGNMTRTEGVVESVIFYDGDPKVIVNGVSYPLYSVMEVKTPGSKGGGAVSQTDAVAYIGKEVNVKYTKKDLDGEEEEIDVTGTVTEVNTGETGEVQVMIDGKAYPAAAVVSVK